MAKLEIGIIVGMENPERAIGKVADLGLRSCQVNSGPSSWTDAAGEALTRACRQHGVTVSTLWAGCSGPHVWDFLDGPRTIGLVPPEHRSRRVAELISAGEFAARWKIPSITTHVGFIPENLNNPDFEGTVQAVRQVAQRCAELGVGFWFETGQETPVTLLRTIQRVGLPNLGVNLDTANLILYGKANPLDALDVLGQWVRGVHVKDGLYPTDGDQLGRETPAGEGKVDFPRIIARLKELGFAGALTIEREISGPQQIEDIRKAIAMLQPLL